MDVYKETIFEFHAGQMSVGTTPAVLPHQRAYKGVRVKADASNTGVIYVGPSTVSASTGYPLAKGEEVLIAVEDPALVSVVADAGGQKIAWLSV